MNNSDTIKSVRVYEERKVIHLDYRLKSNVRIPKGKTHRIRFSTNTKATKIAFNKIEKMKILLAENHYYTLMEKVENKNCNDIKFEDICYEALKEAEAARRKDDGTKDYIRILEADVLPTFGEKYLPEIKPKDIKAWQLLMSKDGISQSRFNKKYYVLKRVLDYAQENDFIQTNPISLIKRSSKLFAKQQNHTTAYYTEQEREALLNYKYDGYSEKEKSKSEFIVAFLHVAFLTGARTGEIMALEWDDIDFEKGLICISKSIRRGILSTTKTDTVRYVPMIERLKLALQKWKIQSNAKTNAKIYVFPISNTGNPYKNSRAIIDSKFKPLLQQLNIPYKKLYNTRHTFASIAAENGISLPTVATCLGHSTVATTQQFYVKMGNLDYNKSRDELEKLA